MADELLFCSKCSVGRRHEVHFDVHDNFGMPRVITYTIRTFCTQCGTISLKVWSENYHDGA